MNETLLVIDGHSVAFRAFYALPVENFTSSGGQATNAIYGFTSMLVRLLEAEKPTHVAVAFDLSRHSFRTDEYPEYKGTRDETPPEFVGQVDIITELLEAMGVRTLTKENYEADDILATLAKEGAQSGLRVLVASGDRDTFQLVNDDVTVLYPGRSMSDLNYMDPAAVEDRYGVTPGRYPELAALVGETSDNLPGVPGVGPKTAAQWLTKYDGLNNLLASADKIGGVRGQALRDHLEDVKRNRRLNRLVDDLDLPLSVSDLVLSSPDRERLQQLFDALNFTGLRQRVYKALDTEVQAVAGTQAPVAEPSVVEPVLATPSTDIAQWLQGQPAQLRGLVYSGSGRPAQADLDGFAFLGTDEVLVVDATAMTPAQEQQLSDYFATAPALLVHDGKATAHAFASRGWDLPTPHFDVELGAYLCHPERRGYAITDLAREYLGQELTADSSEVLFTLDEDGTDGLPPWAGRLAEQAIALGRLQPLIEDALTETAMLPLLTGMELPVQEALGSMEDLGIQIDVDVLDQLASELATSARQAEDDAFTAIGHSANLGSPKQLQGILFEELGMPKTRKTKTGWTTDAEALSDLYAKTSHPFLEALLRHRDATKLAQMVEGLRSAVQPDGRIHTTFLQTVTATGRLASADPNLQNIPARSSTGMRVRDAFVAGPGFVSLMSVDYSQIEMRIMAHLSGDQNLIDAFNSGEDLHRTMAALVFGIPVEDVTPELRGRIKATSYGLAYGLSPFGLSRQLGIGVPEAKELHGQYFQKFAGIGTYLADVVETARATGYTETMFGRRRYFPDLNSTNQRVREMSERAALNAPIQGSAADIIKVATVAVEEQLRRGGFRSRLLLQIHDELLLEIAEGEESPVRELVTEAMATPVRMSVPLEVAIGVGHSWRSAAH